MGFETGSNQTYTDKPEYFDPLGTAQNGNPHATQGTGGPEMRANIFDYLGNNAPNYRASAEQLASGLQGAAKDPGFAAGADLARSTIAGDYLGGGPAFKQALSDYGAGVEKNLAGLRSASTAEAADTEANLRDRFARSGLGFSTANQQASQSAGAAATARANELESGVREGANQYTTGAKLNNYAAERQAQKAGVDQLGAAVGQPLEYLSQVPTAYLSPESQAAQIIAGLAGSGQIATPQSTIVKKPGALDYTSAILGSINA